MSVSQKPNHGRNAAPTKRHGFRSTFNMTGVIIGILGLILATVAIIIPVYEGKISSLKEEHNNGFAQATQRLAAAAARIDSLENALKALQSKNFTLAQQLNWERQNMKVFMRI